MTIEGHWCGTKPCPECGETHACICGNDCAPPLRDQLRPIFWDVFDPDSSAQGNVQAALDAAMPIIEARIAAQRAEWEAEQGETEVEYRARATTGHVYGDVRITPEFAVAAYEEALDRETFEQDDETPVVEKVDDLAPEPQGEPTDAQVLAALNNYEAWSAEETLDMWGTDQVARMRAALRAAGGVQGSAKPSGNSVEGEPTDDEREALFQTLYSTSGDLWMGQETRHTLVLAQRDAVLAAGFRRTVQAEQSDAEVEYRARATTGHVYGDVRITPEFAVAAYEEALDRETFEQDDETPVVETRRVGPWLPVEQGDAS